VIRSIVHYVCAAEAKPNRASQMFIAVHIAVTIAFGLAIALARKLG